MINRKILDKITPWLKKEKILILKGSRQVGKTTLLKKIQKDLEKKNQQVVYLTADRLDDQGIFQSPEKLILFLRQKFDFPNSYLFLMIDEFQMINKAGVFLKNIFDQYKNKLQLIVSGSSSLEITKSTEFLTGRMLEFNVNPVSFREFYEFTQSSNLNNLILDNFEELKLFYETFKKKLEFLLIEYLTFGGYPEVITTQNIENKKIILESIVKTYLEKDIALFLKIENITGFNNLLKILAQQTSSLLNINELSNTVNLAINTTKKYLEILQGTFVINLITPFYKNIRSEISKMPKIYFNDFGLKNFLERSFNYKNLSLFGKDIENFVYLKLQSDYKNDYIHFYRTIAGSEIDFVIETDDKKVFLQEVKFRKKIKNHTAFLRFEKKYPDLSKKNIIITQDILKKEKNTYFIPAALYGLI